MNYSFAATRPSTAAEPAFVAGFIANASGLPCQPYQCEKFKALVKDLSNAGKARKHAMRLWESGWRAAL